MNRFVFKAVLVFVLLAAIAGLGAFAYYAGVTQGAAHYVQINSAEMPAPVYPYPGMWLGMPFFGLLSCLAPLFLLFLVFVALRGLFWNGRSEWRSNHYGRWCLTPMGTRQDWKEGIPPMVAEWHRKMHEGTGSTATPAEGQPDTTAE